METQFETGDEVQYMLPDREGKPHWFKGVVHGVRRYENPATSMTIKVTYIIDTGRDAHVDEYVFDHRDREINKRRNKLVAQGEDPLKAHSKVLKHPDLPESKLDIERVRQPEQIELPADHIRERA